MIETLSVVEQITPAAPQPAAQIQEHWLEWQHGAIRTWLVPAADPAAQARTPLLFIHGYGGLIEHWRRLLRQMAGQRTLCALDLHNFGYSDHLRDVAPSKELWAQQAAFVIRQTFDTPVVVVSHSMGGMVAAQLAADEPELVRGLVLSDSMGLRPDRQPNSFDNALFSIMRAPLVGDLLANIFTGNWAVRQSLQQTYYNQDMITPELIEAFAGPLRRNGGARAYLAVSRSMENFFLDIEPGDLQLPVLIVWGQYDRSMPPAMAERFKREIFPQAQISLVDKAAHCPFDEQPEHFSELLDTWLAKHEL
jgi:pimeloyl-ACP methyl ester carboxylesterase